MPEWFSPKGIEFMARDAWFQKGFVAFCDEQAVGFIFYFVNQGIAEISWMGVSPSQHKKGIGKFLLNAMLDRLAARNVTEILVKTLGDSVVYDPYARTREFYRRCGFKDFFRKMQPENPEMEEELTLRYLIEKNPILERCVQ